MQEEIDMTEKKEIRSGQKLRLIRCLLLAAAAVLTMGLTGCKDSGVAAVRQQLFTREGIEAAAGRLTEWVRGAAELAGRYGTGNTDMELPDIYQVLLIGMDRRQDNWYGNSDAMLLLSINRNKKTVSLVSFMRDLGVTVPGYGYKKINSAYALGGGDLLEATIEQNFGIAIDNYASVDFGGMIRIVDLFGGVTLDIAQEEISVMNNYITEMCGLEGLSPEDYYLSVPGTLHLNGMQAVAYCRNRYTGRYDFERTARQRRVLEQLYLQAKSMDLPQLLMISVQVMPLISHNLTQEQISSLAALAPTLGGYQLTMDRIPYDGLYTSNNENLDPVWDETIARLSALLY